MALKTMIKRINAAHEKYETELAKAGKRAGKEIAKEIGALLPPGWEFTWTQGTPSFNDGDPCTFSVHDPELKRIESLDDDDDDDEDEDEDEDDSEDTEEESEEEESDESEEDDEDEDEDEDEDAEETDDQSEPDEMSLEDAVEKYGKKNKRKYYYQQDYTRPIKGEKDQWGGQKYEQTRHSYVVHGFPAAEGYTKAKLRALKKLWESFPEDVLCRVFGDGARVTITPDGKLSNDEYYDE